MQYLSQEWVDRLAQLGRKWPVRKGLSVTTQYDFNDGAPGPDTRHYARISDGVVMEVALGVDPEADLVVTMPYATAVAYQCGLDVLDEHLLAGGISITGDYRKLEVSTALRLSDSWETTRRAIHADTNYSAQSPVDPAGGAR